MTALGLLFDVRVDPVSPVPWGALIFLLAVVFVLAVALVAGLVALLIWRKRKKAQAVASASAVSPEALS